MVQVFSCEFCKISKNNFFTEHLLWLLLKQIPSYAVIDKPTVRILKIIDPQRKNVMIRLFIHVYYSFIAHVKHYVLLFMI